MIDLAKIPAEAATFGLKMPEIFKSRGYLPALN